MKFKFSSQEFYYIADKASQQCSFYHYGEFMKFKTILTLIFVFACSHQGDRSISSTDEDRLEIPEDYRIACIAKGGILESEECQCIQGGQFIDPYLSEDCPKTSNK